MLEPDVVGSRLLGDSDDVGKRSGGVGRITEIEGDVPGNGLVVQIFREFDGQSVVSDDPGGGYLPLIAAATQILECEDRID